MPADQIVAAWVEQRGKAPWIPEESKMGFSRIVVYIHIPEIGNLLPGEVQARYPISLLCGEDCESSGAAHLG